MTKPFYSDAIINILEQKTENERNGFVGTINDGLSTLFFDIGSIINLKLQNSHDIDTCKSLLKEIADNLEPIFGDYLSLESLSLMRTLAKKCESETVRYAASIISWEYLPYFLNLKENDEWLFYAELIYIESLTPGMLSKRISDNAFGKASKKLNTDRRVFMSAKADSFYQSTLKLYFGMERGHAFRKLFEPKENDDANLEMLSRNKQVNNSVIIQTYVKILEFQSVNNHQLNIQFNILLWDIGVELVRQTKSFGAQAAHDLTDLCIQRFHNTFPSIFNKEDLSHCFKFVEQYGESNPPPMEMVQTVSWPYIKLLLEIDGIEKQVYMANQALKNGMSVQDLNEVISNDTPDFTPTTELPRNTIIETVVTVTKEKNFTATGTMETIEQNIHPKHDINRNIFKNQKLLEFLTEHPI